MSCRARSGATGRGTTRRARKQLLKFFEALGPTDPLTLRPGGGAFPRCCSSDRAGGSPFGPTIEQLPAALPIFPLTGVLLCRGGQAPAQHLRAALPRHDPATRSRASALIGMVQPREGEEEAPATRRSIRFGCAGRIVYFDETDDGRYQSHLPASAAFEIVRGAAAPCTATAAWCRIVALLRPIQGRPTAPSTRQAPDRMRARPTSAAEHRRQLEGDRGRLATSGSSPRSPWRVPSRRARSRRSSRRGSRRARPRDDDALRDGGARPARIRRGAATEVILGKR